MPSKLISIRSALVERVGMSPSLPNVKPQLHHMGCGLECGGRRLKYHVESSILRDPVTVTDVV